MVAVRFLKPWSLYNSDEVAGFDPETAAFLIENGVAVEVTAPAEQAAPAKAPARKR
jgi:hypothetical protein